MSFWLDSVSSDNYHLIVEHYPDRVIAKRKYTTVSVPGRNGDILIEQDAFENVEQAYDVYLSAEATGLPTPARAAAEWLSRKGYRRLEDSYDTDCFRMAQYVGGIDLENIWNKFGRATIRFNCMPQRWLKTGEQEITVSGTKTITNPTNFPASPLITFTKDGATESVITFGDYVLRTGANQSGKTIVVDCFEQNVTANGTMINNITSGSFPVLTGATACSLTNATNIKVVPRWWTI